MHAVNPDGTKGELTLTTTLKIVPVDTKHMSVSALAAYLTTNRVTVAEAKRLIKDNGMTWRILTPGVKPTGAGDLKRITLLVENGIVTQTMIG
jgi:hypothetical protein